MGAFASIFDGMLDKPMSIEQLEHAVRNLHVHEARRCLEGGVNVNEHIDSSGHTIMDAFNAEQATSLVNFGTAFSTTRREDANTMINAYNQQSGEMLLLLQQYKAEATHAMDNMRDT